VTAEAAPKPPKPERLCADTFAVVRAPLLAASQFLALAVKVPDAFDPSTFEGHRAEVRRQLRALVEDPVVREAIYVASASLHVRLAKWLEAPDSKEGRKVEQALVRYLGRMCTRCTPFGLFAGFGLVAVDDTTHLEGLGTTHARRRIRLDMGYLVAIAEALEGDAALRDRLRFRANATMYEVAGRLHVPALVRHATGRAPERHYELLAVEIDEHVQKVRAHAVTGRTRDELVGVLCADETGEAEAHAYIDELICARVLESTLEPTLTGAGALEGLVAQLREVDASHPAIATLSEVSKALDTFAQAPLGATSVDYDQIAHTLAGLPVRSEQPFQVDLALSPHARLGRDDVAEIERGVHVLHVLTPHDDLFSGFRAAFVERYEQREVPLVEVLDDEVGIGYRDQASYAREPAPLLDGLGLRAPSALVKAPPSTAERDRLLLEKLEAAWRSGENSIELRDADLSRFDRTRLPPLPDSLAACVSLLRRDGETLVHLHHWSGPSAARLLGRFAAWSPELAERVRDHLRREEAFRPDAIYAELVHMPDMSRAANVLLRPVLRAHEIAFCGRSGLEHTGAVESLISVHDLTVSVQGPRVVLRSRRFGKEVLPRLSSAHNFAGRQMTMYRFLANLQQQGVAGHGYFSWGAFASARALPRVTSGRLILAPARFTLSAAEISALRRGSSFERMGYLARLRAELRLPRYVGLEDGDNVLPIDLGNSITVDAFVGALAGRESATLIELFLEEPTLLGTGERGKYSSEFIVPFTRALPSAGATSAATSPSLPRSTPIEQRTFAPGSEWLYVKIYCARGSMDGIVRGLVRDLVRSHAALFDRWFFIRYEDPDPHLRLRFHGEPKRLISELLPLVHQCAAQGLDTGRIAKLEVSTYVRELERYGGDITMPYVEQLFADDSLAAIELLELLEGVPEGRARWGYTLLGMHRMLEDFAFERAIRDTLIDATRAAFHAEMGIGEAQERALAERYRTALPYICGLIEGHAVPQAVEDILQRRSAAMAPLARTLRELRRTQRSSVTSENLVVSLLHMWCNRMLRSDPRAHELVMHTFLSRHYESQAARARKGVPEVDA
jgi:thiopeptide-type bacteriocin biosynthesis protein